MSLSHDIDQKQSFEHVEREVNDDERRAALASEYQPGTEAERKLLRRIDKRILPCIWVLYVMSYLDRANIGNAKTGGLEADFKLTSDQYSICLLVFFISYLLFEIPSNLLIAKIRPSIYLSALCVIWGGIAALMGVAQNWQQLAAIRFCLGIAEAGFAPGVIFYLSSWYKKREVASRFAIFYTGTAISGAFSGLLAGVITQYLNGARGLAGWRWLFIIEGSGTVFVGLWTWMIMPDWPSTTKWFTPEEQFLATARLAYDGLANTQGGDEKTGEWKAIKLVFGDWRAWIFVLLYMLSTGAQTIQYFVPTLIGSLGWTGYVGQYHTIPLYACALVFILAFSFLADRLNKKPMFITIAASISSLCFIIAIAAPVNMVKYVFIIIAFGGIYAMPSLILTWVPNIIDSPVEKRAVAIALVNALGNSASLYGVFLWPVKDAPRYVPGFAITTVWVGCIALLAPVALYFFNKYPHKAPGSTARHVEHELEVRKEVA